MINRQNKLATLFFLLWTISSGSLWADTSSAIQDYQAGRFEKAFQEFQAASHTGDATALYYAGLMYVKGQGATKDMGKGLFCLKTAASKGSRDAALTLVDLYQRGEGVPKSKTDADKWAALAAQIVPKQNPQPVVLGSTATTPIQSAQNVLQGQTSPKRQNLLMLMLHNPRRALRVAPILLGLLAIPLFFLFLLLWMLKSCSDEPLPTPPSLSVRGFRSEEAISFGWRLVKHNAGFSVALCLLYLFLISAVHHLTAFIPNIIVSFIALAIWVNVVDVIRMRIALDTFDHGAANGSGIGEGTSRLGGFILARLLYGFISAFGFLLLIIPGIYFQCKYYFAPWIVVDQGIGAMEAMERSSQLTEGVKFRIFIFRIVTYFFFVLGILTLGFGLLFFWPMTWFAEVYFYRSLQRRRIPLSTRVKAPLFGQPPIVWGTLALAGLVLVNVASKRFPLSKAKGYTDQTSINRKIDQIAQGATSKRRAEFDAQKQAFYTVEWQRYKPIYDAFGMSEIWSMMEAGKCDEAEKLLQSPTSYEKMDKALGAASRTKTIAMGLKLCHDRFSPPAEASQPTEQALNENPFERLQKSISAGKSLSALGNMRSALSQCYSETNGHYPASLQGIIGKKTLDNAPILSIPTLVLPDHPETNEVVIYGGEACTPTGGLGVDGSKIKDTGKWGYVADPNTSCYGTVFIDCTHLNTHSNKHWFEY